MSLRRVVPRVINSKLSRRLPTRCIIGGAEAERPLSPSLGGDNKEDGERGSGREKGRGRRERE